MNDIEKQVEVTRHEARKATAVFGIVVGMVVLGSLVVAGLSAQIAARNGKQIAQLNEDLQDARLVIENVSIIDSERDRCERLLQTQVRSAARETQAGIAELVIVISTVTPADRDQAMGDGVARLQEALAFYDQATSQINDWQLLPANDQTPCPEGAKP